MLLSTTFLKAQDDGLKLGNKVFDVYGLKKEEVKNKYKLKGEEIWRQKTLKSFIQSHPKGTFMVLVARHALVVKDGELLDWENNKFEPTRKVMGAYKITEKSSVTQLSLF